MKKIYKRDSLVVSMFPSGCMAGALFEKGQPFYGMVFFHGSVNNKF